MDRVKRWQRSALLFRAYYVVQRLRNFLLNYFSENRWIAVASARIESKIEQVEMSQRVTSQGVHMSAFIRIAIATAVIFAVCYVGQLLTSSAAGVASSAVVDPISSALSTK